MNKTNLIIIGGGGHAKACIDVIISTNQYNIIGYLGNEETLDPKYGVPYLGDDTLIEEYVNSASFLITVGQIKSSEIRKRIFTKLNDLNAAIATVISKHAIVSKYATIGRGTIVMHSAIIQANVIVGENCIINDRALLEHDVIVDCNCHISTGVILNGEVTISNNSFIGSGAIVNQKIIVGNNVIIGSGALVNRNVDDFTVVYGNPAKVKALNE
jgi:sugar O-acyltransferase (sialic acid O-acetyltransferase NeuD family)